MSHGRFVERAWTKELANRPYTKEHTQMLFLAADRFDNNCKDAGCCVAVGSHDTESQNFGDSTCCMAADS